MTDTARDGIPIEVMHQVPAIRWDARAGRERLTCLVARTRGDLRVLPKDCFEMRPSTGVSWSRDGGSKPDPDRHWFEGRAWRRAHYSGLDDFERQAGDGRALRSLFGLQFTETLTLKTGKALPDAIDPAGIRERYDAEAAAFFRAKLETDIGFDGTDVWIGNDLPEDAGQPSRPRRWSGMMTGLHALMMAAEARGLDADIERASDPVRRLVARNAVGALAQEELGDAYRATMRLCEGLCDRHRRGPKGATARMWVGLMAQKAEAADRAAALSCPDGDDLAGLAP